MIAALLRRLAREDGIAMVLVVLLTAFMTLLAVGLIDTVRAESDRGARANWSQTSFEAAQAGLDDYVSKLVDDNLYYLHSVHPAESTRSPSEGVLAPHSADCSSPDWSPKTTLGVPWAHSRVWTYPNGKDHWCRLPNGFYYNLQISAPGSAANPTTSVRIVATGRRSMSTAADMRAIESYVRPSNLADFYRFSDANVSIDAETYGKIYSNGNVNHTGTAHADIYAEGAVTGSPTMVDGAQVYQYGNFGTKIKNHPIDFSKFLVSLTDIKRAAQTGGVYLQQAGATSWNVVFGSGGTFTAAACTGSSPELTAPACGSPATYPVPSNGAIFADVTVIVSGQVDGRVTVGTADDIVVRDGIAPVTGGDDVIGLVAYSDLWVAAYAPAQLTWNAAVLVHTNTWHAAGSSKGAGSKMTFKGSSATATGGSFTQYASRVYSYDENLQFLSPPWFPAVDDSYTVTFFRDVKP